MKATSQYRNGNFSTTVNLVDKNDNLAESESGIALMNFESDNILTAGF